MLKARSIPPNLAGRRTREGKRAVWPDCRALAAIVAWALSMPLPATAEVRTENAHLLLYGSTQQFDLPVPDEAWPCNAAPVVCLDHAAESGD